MESIEVSYTIQSISGNLITILFDLGDGAVVITRMNASTLPLDSFAALDAQLKNTLEKLVRQRIENVITPASEVTESIGVPQTVEIEVANA